MKNRKGFSVIEFLLVVVILGLLVAVFVPATAVMAEKHRVVAVESNLDAIAEAGKKYISDKSANSVDYKTLVSEKYLEPVQPVAGESYDGIKIESGGGKINVVTAKGSEVTMVYYVFRVFKTRRYFF